MNHKTVYLYGDQVDQDVILTTAHTNNLEPPSAQKVSMGSHGLYSVLSSSFDYCTIREQNIQILVVYGLRGFCQHVPFYVRLHQTLVRFGVGFHTPLR